MYLFLSGILRRLIGGLWSTIPIIKERGFQWFLGFFLYIPIVYCNSYGTFLETNITKWIFTVLTVFFVMLELSGGHFFYFKCGTESDEYIDEQEAKGRKPAMDWLVRPVNKWLGFEPRSKQYCFIGMLCRYGLWSIPVALFVGWQFVLVGCMVPFIYNACFWIEFPPCRLAKSPTNWAELITGFFVGWGLL